MKKYLTFILAGLVSFSTVLAQVPFSTTVLNPWAVSSSNFFGLATTSSIRTVDPRYTVLIATSTTFSDVGRLTLGVYGSSTQIQTPINSSAAFRILNSASSTILNINTINGLTTLDSLTVTNASTFGGNMTPVGSVDIGASGNRFNNVYANNLNVLTATISQFAAGNLTVAGDMFINGNDINLGTGSATSTISGGFGIGVGTTTPGAAFAVATSTAGLNTAFLLSNLGSGYTMWVEDSANDTTPFVINAAGNVGIGTTGPAGLLSVGASSQFTVSSAGHLGIGVAPDATGGVMMTLRSDSGGGTLVNLDDAASGGRKYAFMSSNNGNSIVSGGKFAVYDYTSNKYPFVIDSNQNVGIGGSNSNSVLGGMNMVVLASGNVGIGTTSPFSTLGINAVQNIYPFVIASTTASQASSTLFAIDKNGDVHLGGGTPVLSGCGTNPLLDANSTDQAGTVTFGSTATGCTITRSVAALSSPHCPITPRAISLINAYTIAITTSSITITQAASGGTVWDYACFLGH